MERTKEMWADIHYPPTENEIKYNKMILNYDQLGSIVEDVCVRTRTTHDEIYSKTKDNHVTFSRYLIYYLSQKTGHRLNSIVRYMKSNGFKTTPSTVIYGIKQVESKMKNDEDIKTYIGSFLSA